MFGHIIHLAVIACSEPGGEARLGIRQVGITDADRTEPQLAPPRLDALREREQRGFVANIEAARWPGGVAGNVS
jgi:hypothetical protein